MAGGPKNSKPVVFIGAGDVICGKAIEYFAGASDLPIVLADGDEDTIRQSTANLPPGRATIKKLNISEPAELHSAIAGAALVVLGAQPYYCTSGLVLAACLEAKVPYFDYSDDVKSTQEALDLFDRAKQQGIPCYINCGSSPGMSNILAVDAAKELDICDAIDVAWYVTDRGGQNGKEVLEHLMHITAGPCLTWEDGKPAIHENWVETAYANMIPGEHEVLLHETTHPEPVTLPRIFPRARRIRCLGALNPVPFNGFARGLASAVYRGALPMDTAIDFLWNLAKRHTATSETSGGGWIEGITAQLRGGEIKLKEFYYLALRTAGSLNPWRYAIWGMIQQIRDGECSAMDVVRFMVDSARGRHPDYRAGIVVRALGTRNGHPTVVVRRQATTNPDLEESMAANIGFACATFLLMVLETDPDGLNRAGVFCPEDWADVQAYYKGMERLGRRPEDIIESFRM
ncbi:hypothetical protein CLAIMM_11180 [Cladophialophora immunda]|nr:hypothetical protein CLAIMM_11180 [Cladophialophora immunda]